MQQLLYSGFDKGDSWTADPLQQAPSRWEPYPEMKLNITVILISSGLLCEDQEVFAKVQNKRDSPFLLLHKKTKLKQFHSVWMETSERRRRRIQILHYT